MTARILVVDDEPDLELLIVQRFRRQIRDGQFSFTFADDGVNALAALSEDQTIDMVLCDINMPRMDGLTLLGRLQERDDHLATVIVSAYGDMANIRTAMNRGAFDFVTKPIDFADLETTIGKTLRNLEITRGYQRRQQEAERARAQLGTLFLAQPGRLHHGGDRRYRSRRAAARHHLDVHRYRELHDSGRGPGTSHDRAAAERVSHRHDRDRVRSRRHIGEDRRRCAECAVRRPCRSA